MAPIGATRVAKNPTQPRVVENPLIAPCADSVDTKTRKHEHHTKRASDTPKATKQGAHDRIRVEPPELGQWYSGSGKATPEVGWVARKWNAGEKLP